MDLKCLATRLQYILFVFTLITLKLQVLNIRSTYQLTALLSEITTSSVRVGCEISLATCGMSSFSDTAIGVYAAARIYMAIK